MFPTITEYENLVYDLPNKYPEIEFSNLVLKRVGFALCYLEGEVHFPNDIKLSVDETIDFDNNAIETYSYEVYRGTQKLYWYDSQPHPHDHSLSSSHPHHKHIAPDIKHHRVPAPNLSFVSHNLPFLIEEIIEALL